MRPRRRCLGRGTPGCKGWCSTEASWCSVCARRRKAERNRERGRAKAAVKASPRCAKCGRTSGLQADHVLPRRLAGVGGKLQVLCATCNGEKGGKVMADPTSPPAGDALTRRGTRRTPSNRGAERPRKVARGRR